MSDNELSKKDMAIQKVEASQNPFIKETHQRSLDILNDLNQLSLVTPNEVALLNEAKEFIKDCYIDVPSHRTLIQKNVGVLTDARFKTADAKFWQCKKEAEVQFEQLFDAYINYQAVLVDVKELLYEKEIEKQKIEEYEDNNEVYNKRYNKEFDPNLSRFQIQRYDLKIQSLNMKLKKLEKEIKYRISEISDWYKIAEEWKPKMKYGENEYYKHELESLVNTLKAHMAEAQKKGDSKAFNNFKDQLDTLERIVKERVNKSVKEDNLKEHT
jgi:tRNA nucleotidyltransferase/poly(A) polymerase